MKKNKNAKSFDKKVDKKFDKSKDKNKKYKKEYNKEPKLAPIEEDIMNFLRDNQKEEISSRGLIKALKIKNKNKFYDSIKVLSKLGYIEYDKKHNIKFNKKGEVTGTVVSLSAGFAFVYTEDNEGDIFIPGRDLRGAFIGDKVVVSHVKKDDKGRIGRIARILESGNVYTTGTVISDKFGVHIKPDNSLRYNLQIENEEMAYEGEKVYVKIRRDERGEWTKAKIVKSYGSGQSARVCSEAILEQHDVPVDFSDEAMTLAKKIKRTGVTEKDLEGRLDLRNEAIFTIDGKESKDLDDAISIKKFPRYWELGVHIADVSHYIEAFEPLDRDAFDRGTSVYFADRVVPMLPKEISNGICSLTAGTDKLCLSAIIKLTTKGEIKSYSFHKTVINSKVKGVYDEINRIYTGKPTKRITEKYAEVSEQLALAYELAEILKANSKKRGTMEIESGESKFIMDKDGVCIGVKPRESGPSQELIEQFMICANVCAAKFSQDNEIPFVYRIHEKPSAQKLAELTEILRSLTVPHTELYNDEIKTAYFRDILDRVKGTDYETVVSQRVLRAMEKAKYLHEELGHFGLALNDYSHFTSPIRRYADLAIHRIITAKLSGMDNNAITKRFKNFTEKSATQSSNCELRALKAERSAEDCYMAEYMSAHVGEKFSGKISGVTKNGVFVRLESSVEGFVSIDDFKGYHFVFDGSIKHKCINSNRILTIGTPLNIIVASTHVATGKVDFTIDE